MGYTAKDYISAYINGNKGWCRQAMRESDPIDLCHVINQLVNDEQCGEFSECVGWLVHIAASAIVTAMSKYFALTPIAQKVLKDNPNYKNWIRFSRGNCNVLT